MSNAVAISTPAGRQAVAPLQQAPKFSEGISRHHRPFYDDYNVAKSHIHQALGDITTDGLELVGREVCVAVYCRPNMMRIKSPSGDDKVFFLPVKEIKEDWWQHKAGLIVAMGPTAFHGDDSYLDAMFGLRDEDGELIPGSGRPRRWKVGDWLFGNPSSGMQIQLCGEGASRPQGVDNTGEAMDLFEWDGWPCRIVLDDVFVGRIAKPHSVV